MPSKNSNMTNDVDCVLKIPSSRTECVKWIHAQAPNIVADVLSMSESMYNSMKRGICTDDNMREKFLSQFEMQEKKMQDTLEKAVSKENDRVRKIQQTHLQVVEKYQEQVNKLELELQNSKSSWNMSLKEEVEKERHQLESEVSEKEKQITHKFNNSIELLKEQLKNQDEHMKRLREQYTDSLKTQETDLKTQHDNEFKALKEQYLQQVEDNRRVQGENAIFKEKVREDCDAKIQDCVKQNKIEKDLLEKQLQNELLRYEDDRNFLRKQVEDKDKEIKHIHEHGARVLEEKTNEIASIIRNITGSTTAIGRFGEKFVNKVHAQMQLGTYTDDAHIKQQGFADGTWELKFSASNIEDLVCMIDAKYGFPDKSETQLHSQKDIKKFEDDTRTAVSMGRINCSMLISLVKRIPGKPRLSMDTSLGVPTVWVSRDADDAIPAQAIIEMGFLMLAEAWPVISKKHNDETNINDILQAIANNLECQILEYEKLEKHIKKIEDSAQLQLRNVCEMKKIQTNLVQNTHSFRIRYPAISALTTINPQTDFWEKEGQELMQAIRNHRATKGRNRYYPKAIEELNLSDEIMSVIRNIPNAFELAKNKVKDEMQDTKRTQPKSDENDDAKRQKIDD